MGEEKLHVPAMELWGYTNGTVNLKDDDFEHLLFCIECQTLVSEFIEVLDRLPRTNSPSQAA
jgi:hypothetical protein